ncbi:hypothetical protein EB001_07495 [bacterium]|nr:hypothetical protein [bacterium]
MKYLLAHEASRWTQSHYSQKAFDMINIQSARNFLNKVSPEIREHWEKKNNVSLAESIAEIESIDMEKMPGEDRIRTCRNAVKILSLTIFLLFLTIGVLAYNYPHIQPVYPYTLGGLILIAFVAIACIQIHKINLENKLSEHRYDQKNKQEILSGKVSVFWDTILKVCEHDTLPEDKPVDAEYLKGVLHVAIKDLLLKQAVLRMKNSNPSFDVDNVAAAAIEYRSADLYLDIQWGIVKDKLGVDIKRREMFKKAEDEMRITHPGLSQYFKTTEG